MEARTTDLEPRFSWPLSPAPVVSRPFDAPTTSYGPGHRGVDLVATPGQQVLAAGPGVVVFAGQVAGQGVVSIDHDGGLRTTYEPVTPLVAAGAQVLAGQPIGTVNPGHPDCPAPACLHWGVRRGEEYLSPLGLIRALSVIRLKPWITEASGLAGSRKPGALPTLRGPPGRQHPRGISTPTASAPPRHQHPPASAPPRRQHLRGDEPRPGLQTLACSVNRARSRRTARVWS
ncbi:M23 family metallopeptidase [Amycolatopsis sp. K13G38]|uniref:M23 family metallopeptidase n=1 Tax=Amycolatopsis acididurans TaxID=2724524 RepID=A0ABX1JAQ5_9PSEU|nr:M23 family metallopeptidase [Amycolatopsis acididurans]